MHMIIARFAWTSNSTTGVSRFNTWNLVIDFCRSFSLASHDKIDVTESYHQNVQITVTHWRIYSLAMPILTRNYGEESSVDSCGLNHTIWRLCARHTVWVTCYTVLEWFHFHLSKHGIFGCLFWWLEYIDVFRGVGIWMALSPVLSTLD